MFVVIQPSSLPNPIKVILLLNDAKIMKLNYTGSDVFYMESENMSII